MVKSVLAQKLRSVDYDNNGTFDLGFFQPIAGSPPQGQLGVWLLGQSSGLPTAQAAIGGSFPYGEAGWVPGFIGQAAWFLNGSSLLSPDLNGDGKTDQIFASRVFTYENGVNTFQGYELGTWFMDGAGVSSYRSLVNASGQAAVVPKDWANPSLYSSIRGRGPLGDFNGDGTSDLLFLKRNSNGTTEVGLWLINNGVAVTQQGIATAAAGWNVINANDFDGNGTTDLLFTRGTETGGTEVGVWTLNGTQVTAMASVNTAPAGWQIVDTNDFSGDGKADILWTKAELDGSTRVALWTMNGTQATAYREINVAPADWSLIDHNDFNADGKADLLFTKTLQDGSQQYGVWLLNGANDPLAYQVVDTVAAGSNWAYYGSGDTNGNGTADLLFYNTTSKDLGVWQLGSNGLPAQQQVIGTLSGDWRSPFLLDPLGDMANSGFAGAYAPSNWSLQRSTINGVTDDSSVNSSGAPDQLIFYGGNVHGNNVQLATEGTSTYTIAINSGSPSAIFSFNWAFDSYDNPYEDVFGVVIDEDGLLTEDDFTLLADVAGQSGTFSQMVSSSTRIGFWMGTTDNRYGAGYATISDFNVSPVFGDL
jgi:hypothetical protein